jgi:hypothetical protein
MIGLLYFALAILASPFKSRLRLEAANAALRHQLMVLRRRLRGRGRRRRRIAAWRGRCRRPFKQRYAEVKRRTYSVPAPGRMNLPPPRPHPHQHPQQPPPPRAWRPRCAMNPSPGSCSCAPRIQRARLGRNRPSQGRHAAAAEARRLAVLEGGKAEDGFRRQPSPRRGLHRASPRSLSRRGAFQWSKRCSRGCYRV